MVFLDWTRRRRAAEQLTPLRPVSSAGGGKERGSGYLALRRTVEESQVEFDREPDPAVPAGRQSAAYVRLDRMYEVTMLVAAACEVAGVPPPEPVPSWPGELIRLRDLRERNTRQARLASRPRD